jgi:pilus assembly protein CpaF
MPDLKLNLPTPQAAATGTDSAAQMYRSPTFLNLKSHFHRKLVDKLNLEAIDQLDRKVVEDEIRSTVLSYLAEEQTPLSLTEREKLIEEIIWEIFGLGPLEPLLQDDTISDILINTHNQVMVDRAGRLERTGVVFRDDNHLMQVIDRIVSAVGRRVDDSSPMVDARLPDGSRVNAIIPPLAVDGPHLSIRKFRKDPITAEHLVGFNTLTLPMLEVLKGAVRARLNILISGGTGSGKTTLLNALSAFVPEEERIVTIEDSAELQLKQEHVVRLETRPANIEGKGSVTQRHLVINALRMRPDRILVGEVRGAEALDMLQAMNTGHEGSLTTLHANSPRDALARLETMIAMAALDLPERAMRQQIAAALDIVIQLARLSDGTRKIVSFSEVIGMEGDVVTMQEIFNFERVGIDERGRVLGNFHATGIRPYFSDRLRVRGIQLPMDLFEPHVLEASNY